MLKEILAFVAFVSMIGLVGANTPFPHPTPFPTPSVTPIPGPTAFPTPFPTVNPTPPADDICHQSGCIMKVKNSHAVNYDMAFKNLWEWEQTQALRHSVEEQKTHHNTTYKPCKFNPFNNLLKKCL